MVNQQTDDLDVVGELLQLERTAAWESVLGRVSGPASLWFSYRFAHEPVLRLNNGHVNPYKVRRDGDLLRLSVPPAYMQFPVRTVTSPRFVKGRLHDFLLDGHSLERHVADLGLSEEHGQRGLPRSSTNEMLYFFTLPDSSWIGVPSVAKQGYKMVIDVSAIAVLSDGRELPLERSLGPYAKAKADAVGEFQVWRPDPCEEGTMLRQIRVMLSNWGTAPTASRTLVWNCDLELKSRYEVGIDVTDSSPAFTGTVQDNLQHSGGGMLLTAGIDDDVEQDIFEDTERLQQLFETIKAHALNATPTATETTLIRSAVLAGIEAVAPGAWTVWKKAGRENELLDLLVELAAAIGEASKEDSSAFSWEKIGEAAVVLFTQGRDLEAP